MMTTGRAALIGAGQGALIGLIFALFFGIFFAGPAFAGLLLYAVVAGAIFGAALAAIAHAGAGWWPGLHLGFRHPGRPLRAAGRRGGRRRGQEADRSYPRRAVLSDSLVPLELDGRHSPRSD